MLEYTESELTVWPNRNPLCFDSFGLEAGDLSKLDRTYFAISCSTLSLPRHIIPGPDWLLAYRTTQSPPVD